MSSYGHVVMILGFLASGSMGAAHWRCGLKCVGLSPTLSNFLFNNFLNAHCIVKMINTELQDINQLMGYRDAQ